MDNVHIMVDKRCTVDRYWWWLSRLLLRYSNGGCPDVDRERFPE